MKFPKIIASGLIQKDNKFLLVKELLEDGKEYWIIPGGKVEFGESIVEGMLREIKEETNLDIEVTKFLDFKEAIVPDYNYHTVIFFYLAKPLHTNIKISDESIEAKFFTKEEMKALNLVSSAKWLFDKHF